MAHELNCKNIVIRDQIFPKASRFVFKNGDSLESDFIVTVGYLLHMDSKTAICELDMHYHDYNKCPTFERIFNDFCGYCKTHILPNDKVEIISLECERRLVRHAYIDGNAFILDADFVNNVDL